MNILQQVNLFGKAYISTSYDIDERYEYVNFMNREIVFYNMIRLLKGKDVVITTNNINKGLIGYISELRRLDKRIMAYVYTDRGHILINLGSLELLK